MERLAGVEEILDGPLDDLDAVAGNLRDLRRVNRLLGGTRLSRLAIDRLWPDGTSLSVLDVGTGGADIPVSLLADAARARTVAPGRGDRQPSRGDRGGAARAARPGPGRRTRACGSPTGWRSPTPTARSTSPTARWSSTISSPPTRSRCCGRWRRVARLGIVVNDLVRGRLLLGGRLGHEPRRDAEPLDPERRAAVGPAGVQPRRSFAALVDQAGLRTVGEVGGFVGHRVAIARGATAMTSRRASSSGAGRRGR